MRIRTSNRIRCRDNSPNHREESLSIYGQGRRSCDKFWFSSTIAVQIATIESYTTLQLRWSRLELD
ncbi:hypothetical protein SCLCIDRAFT_1185211 [Scleroderma citrinum Foug A]|uniref:Uncharacterized protein n=1 Tax=Scleroderma citrinum Foug A TaxID=1036808 RepID=A0A0C3DUX6_9AGAM|nr:hypothetical protein SCLCIDRAFT_1185211 [Scleroderma citrinum Foug A]